MSTASCFREEETKRLIQLLESYSSMFLASSPLASNLATSNNLGIILCQKAWEWASSGVSKGLASFPGSSAPKREIELVHAERAWYFFSREHHQR